MLMQRLRGDAWCRAIRVLAPLGAFVIEGWPAAIGAILFQEGGLWAARRVGGDCGRSAIATRLFVAAYGLRVAIALPTHYIAKLGNGNGAIFQDDYTNDLVGEWLVRIARGDGVSIFPGHQYLLDSVYPYLLMALYAIFGHAPLLPKLLNCAAAAIGVVLVFHITRRAFSARAGLLAAAGAMLLPTLVVWSIVTVKESLVLLFTLVGLEAVRRMTFAHALANRSATVVVGLMAVMAILLDLRWTTSLILAGLLILVAVARLDYRLRPWQLGIAGAAVVLVVTGGLVYARSHASNRPASAVVEDVVLQIRHRRAQEAASARSQIRPAGDVLNATGGEIPRMEAASDAAPFSVMDDVVDPLGYALLSPAPWQARSLTELAASGEMLIWYGLIVGSLVAWRAAPQQRLFILCVVAFGVANWIVLAVSEGNLGNLLRHRVALAPSLLVLGAGGLEWLWLSLWRPRVASNNQRPLHLVQAE
jgi:4-amino-4-deoxy-L-arabinose transferase-like glycosyltransferase